MGKVNLKKATTLILLATFALSATSLTGCKRPGKDLTAATNPADAPASPVPDETPPLAPGEDPAAPGQSEMPKEPTDTPEPLPAPTKPVQAGQQIGVKALAKTTSFIAPVGGIKGTYVNIELTWQPVIGAKEYWVYKTLLPTKEQATRGSAYKIVKADGFLSTIFIDGALPPSFAGGNIWDKIKKGLSAITIRPGTEYKYKVVAVDETGAPIGESDSATTVPLPPIAAPINLKVSDTASVKPLFEWEESEGVPSDGYFVSVHPPILFGKQTTDASGSFGYAYWSTFRLEKTKVARFGSQSDNAVSYPGTLPFNISTPLKMGSRYSVSITSVKTDTNDMRTARAISKAWSDSKMFAVGSNNPVNPVDPNNPNPAPSASSAPSSAPSESWWSKAKKLVGLGVNSLK